MAAKTIAEETALEYAEKNGLTVVTVCPCLVLGPLLQPVVNTSSEFLIYVIKGYLCIFLLFFIYCSLSSGQLVHRSICLWTDYNLRSCKY